MGPFGIALRPSEYFHATNIDLSPGFRDGVPIKGLYATSEVVGLYYKTYTGATSVLKGAVFGRMAGVDAAKVT